MKSVFLRFAILLPLVVIGGVYYTRSTAREEAKREKYLENNIVFEGHIIALARSNNHAFGIIQLKLTKCNVKAFHKTLSTKFTTWYYPYQIQDSIAELYCSVSSMRKIGDFVKVVSNQKTIYYNPATSKETGHLYLTNSSYDRDFVKEHTVFGK